MPPITVVWGCGKCGSQENVYNLVFRFDVVGSHVNTRVFLVETRIDTPTNHNVCKIEEHKRTDNDENANVGIQFSNEQRLEEVS